MDLIRKATDALGLVLILLAFVSQVLAPLVPSIGGVPRFFLEWIFGGVVFVAAVFCDRLRRKASHQGLTTSHNRFLT